MSTPSSAALWRSWTALIRFTESLTAQLMPRSAIEA
jgi:hypothetical protein